MRIDVQTWNLIVLRYYVIELILDGIIYSRYGRPVILPSHSLLSLDLLYTHLTSLSTRKGIQLVDINISTSLTTREATFLSPLHQANRHKRELDSNISQHQLGLLLCSIGILYRLLCILYM